MHISTIKKKKASKTWGVQWTSEVFNGIQKCSIGIKSLIHSQNRINCLIQFRLFYYIKSSCLYFPKIKIAKKWETIL